MAKTYSYILDDNLYINLTNKCSNACEFCVRNGKNSYYGNSLWLDSEPTVEEVIASIDFGKKYNQIVFCGFGEPTYRIDEVVKLAKLFKEKGYITRINTNGQGNLINGRDITEDLCRYVDIVNVSLNSYDKESYQKVCHSVFGENAFDELIDFAKKCQNHGANVVLSIVDCIGNEAVEKCKKLCKDNGLEIKIREMIEDS